MLCNIWKTTAFSKKTKLKLYNSCVLSVLLYGSECWRMTDKDMATTKCSALHKYKNKIWFKSIVLKKKNPKSCAIWLRMLEND
jgi:hypothetical protein